MLYIILLALACCLLYSLRKRTNGQRVLIIVLGDIGRSPRMQYHALSLLNHGFHVDIVGYSGSTPMQALLNSAQVNFVFIPTPKKIPPGLSRLAYLIRAIYRVIYQFGYLLFIVLFYLYKPDVVLIQV